MKNRRPFHQPPPYSSEATNSEKMYDPDTHRIPDKNDTSFNLIYLEIGLYIFLIYRIEVLIIIIIFYVHYSFEIDIF